MPHHLSQQMLENLTTAVLLVDGGLVLRAMNPSAEMLFETGARQAIGQALVQLLPRNQPLIEAMHQTLVSGHPFTEHGLRISVPGNRWVTVDCSVTPLGHDELLVEINPIDRLLRLAREENRHDQHLASRAVIRGLAHEIKNPLGGLRGAAQLLERELPSESLKEYTRIIIHEADRLRNLVDRMVGPVMPLQKSPTNIHQVMDRVRRLIRAEVPDNIRVIHDFDPSIPEFLADAEQLIQAVLNVARNALQAMNSEGVIRFRTRIDRQFTIGQKRHRHVVRAEIEDTGPGIPDELREQIFYPMVTGKPDGTGLGLSIAQDIVHRHGGVIEFSSRPQQTIFRIFLPLEHASDERSPVNNTATQEQGHV
ncbi:MAG: nitrogen regulation protein NR(II) [Gammaproteobacteria bacterium]|nr:nitrogen regulation protein NR(II) [Gammaproteobacteria bacterium]